MRILSFLVLAVIAANASAQPVADSEPVVEVFLPPPLRQDTALAFSKAQRVATEIYSAIGVRVVWPSNGQRPTGCAKEAMHRRILVAFQESDPRFVSDQALAWSNPNLTTGPCITLLIDRVKAAIQLNPLSFPFVLGHALAHELGHVLEGIPRHSDSGLMKARWSFHEVAGMMKNQRLEFASDDADLIRAALGVGPLANGGKAVASVGLGEVQAAAEKATSLLQNASVKWFGKRTCASCHHQYLPLIVFDLARRHGVPVNAQALKMIATGTFGYLADLDRAVQGSYLIDVVRTMGYSFPAGDALGLPHSESTGAYARLIARLQLEDGHWRTSELRPPSTSAFTATALAARTLQLFLPEEMADERHSRVDTARRWLLRTRPFDTEDHVYRIFGLSWTGAPPESLTEARDGVLALQHPDGGWGQITGRASDAYATGQALAALNQAAGLAVTDPAYQRGLRFLLSTQKTDGMWFVPSRMHAPAPVSPDYFESGLPYGHDQFISAMGTSWAAAALLLALPESVPSPVSALGPLAFGLLRPANVPAWARTLLFGGEGDLRTLLASGWDPNSSTAKGTTALMMAAPDPGKTALLLQFGAIVNAKSDTRYTALMIAASHSATRSVGLLLAHDAEAQPAKGQPALFGATPLILAVSSGDVDSVKALLDRGVNVSPRMLAAGVDIITPLQHAAELGDSVMADALIANGAAVDEEDEDDHVTALGWAVLKSDTEMAKLLIARGANVNHLDGHGFSPLHWAANVYFGDTAMVELLLRLGADPTLRNKEGQTPVDLAARHGHWLEWKILEEVLSRTVADH